MTTTNFDRPMSKTIAGMAIMPSRADRARIAVASLARQVDEVRVCWQSDGYPWPLWHAEHPNVSWRSSDNRRGGLEKFLSWRDDDPDDALWLGCDDDLEYPYSYAHTMARWLDAVTRRGPAMVSAHGRSPFILPMTDYYKQTVDFPCIKTVPALTSVPFLGSGVSAFRLGTLRMRQDDFPVVDGELMHWGLDVNLSGICKARGIQPWVVPHPQGWLGYDHDAVPIGSTLWAQRNRQHCAKITALANKICGYGEDA